MGIKLLSIPATIPSGTYVPAAGAATTVSTPLYFDLLERVDIRAKGAAPAASAATNTAAIIAAAAQAKVNGTVLSIPSATFSVNPNEIVLDCHVESAPGAQFNQSADGVCIDVGTAGANTFDKRFSLPRVNLVSETWDTGSPGNEIGVRQVGGLQNCVIDVPYAGKFTTGCKSAPNDSGSQNVWWNIGWLNDCKVGFHIEPIGAGGWANEGVVYIQRMNHSHLPTHDAHKAGVRGVKIGPLGAGAVNFINGWKFFGASLEGNVAEYAIECYGSYNTFYGCRFETPARGVVGTIESGSLSTFTLELSQVTRMTAFDVGQAITITGAGTAGAMHSTTVSARTATTITLAAPAVTPVSGVTATVFSAPQVHWGVSGANATAVGNRIDDGTDAEDIIVTTDGGAIRNVVEHSSLGSVLNARTFRGGRYVYQDGISVGTANQVTITGAGVLNWSGGAQLYGNGAALQATGNLGLTGTLTPAGRVTAPRFEMTTNLNESGGAASATDQLIGALLSGDSAYRVTLNRSGKFVWTSGAADASTDRPVLERGGLGLMNLTMADWAVATAGRGLRVKEGSNAKQGVSTLVGGTVTVANTSVTTNSRIFLSVQSLGTVAVPKSVGVTARSVGTSFTITSEDATDTSVVAWEIFEPAA